MTESCKADQKLETARRALFGLQVDDKSSWGFYLPIIGTIFFHFGIVDIVRINGRRQVRVSFTKDISDYSKLQVIETLLGAGLKVYHNLGNIKVTFDIPGAIYFKHTVASKNPRHSYSEAWSFPK